jgi:acyl-CoA synthetase (AMP-forming)/AMP-acid ligase II/acetyltransferase-like isoleucine patch superfamily enzyme/acyl carrier protein
MSGTTPEKTGAPLPAHAPSRSPRGTGSTKLASPLVSACWHLLQPNGSISGDAVAKAILPNFPDLCSALPADYFASRPALLGVDDRKPLTHARIRDFILKELGPSLHEMGYGRGNRIALVLPNGPELALALLGLAQWASCVPLNANGAHSELKKDLHAAKVSMVVGMAEDSAAIQDMARALNIPFCGLVKSETEVGVFRLIPMSPPHHLPPYFIAKDPEDEYCCTSDNVCQNSTGGRIYKTNSMDESEHTMFSNHHDDEVLVLFTSGTTGNKKLVPHKLGDMLIAAACISVSWNLSPEDINCNLMPLFHVGGIVRQIFAPTLSAGSVICCPSFDPQLFWQLLTKKGTSPNFTWYYAAPTMHQVILANTPEDLVEVPKLRMIANAAGGLLPSLARELRKTFRANVLPSYGMTECMPISSPPFSYQLEKPGTSGVAVGPQVTIFSNNFEILPPGSEGNICVRGRPCFHGYGGQSQGESFLEGGWFNTGDLGYLDKDGYLYITGRSKEVINRGGEIISPMEVEEEVRHHPSVKDCLAFSAPHDVLQEIVGIVIVPRPNTQKVDLISLHEFLQERLATAKWPQCLVFMDALPKSHTNKLLRVKLGQRLNLPDLNDAMYPVERTYEATCPPQGTPVGVSIPCERVTVDIEYIQEVLHDELGLVYDSYVDVIGKDTTGKGEEPGRHLIVTAHPTRIGGIVVHAINIDRLQIIKKANGVLDAYLQPCHIVSYPDKASMSNLKKFPDATDSVSAILSGNYRMTSDPMIQDLQQIMQDMVDLDCLPAPDTNFFHIGGSSLMASQLASKLRKKYKVSFSGADIFRYNTCLDIAKRIQHQKPEHRQGVGSQNLMDDTLLSVTSNPGANTGGCWIDPYKQCPRDLQDTPLPAGRLQPQNNLFAALVQLIPGVAIFPLFQFSRFFLFFMCLLAILDTMPGYHNLLKFILTLVGYHFAWTVATPLIFIPFKWIVIGEYKEGRYAFWSFYYLRWWIVDVTRKIIGRGVWGSHDSLLIWYYRMLGANIDAGVRISLLADIAEYDLVTINNNAKIEYSTVRGFGVDNGAMILGPVTVGESASTGILSIVAPFTKVPAGAHVGPASSSYELTHNDDRHLSYNRFSVPEPNFWWQTFLCSPIAFLVDTISHFPAMFVLYQMVLMHVRGSDSSLRTVDDLMEWLCEPRRIPYYMGIRVARGVLAPVFYMGAAMLVKWWIIGEFKEGPRDVTSQWQLSRHWLAAHLFCRENMQEIADLLGRHYEPVSVLYRMLGAKVGKRVFWPGHQPVFSGEFDLLQIGDDVVFGSRTVIICTSRESCDKVIFCAGANVSDNTVVLPGGIIGKNAVLASNTVCPAGRYLPESSIWLGSTGGEPILLEPGTEENASAPMLSCDVKKEALPMQGDETTLRPFGKAVYNRQANYFVWTPIMMICFNVLSNIFFEIFHSLPLLSSLHLGAIILYGFPGDNRDYDNGYVTAIQLFETVMPIFTAMHLVRVLLCFVVEIGAKWLLLGRRSEGRFNWDKSSYGQRWEFYQIITRIRRLNRVSTLDFIAGSTYITWYFRSLGSKIGKDCCLYPAGGDPFMPEPDLVTIGDRCVVDLASIVAHLNTRGNFELVKINLDNHATLRSRSRLQQGVKCEAGSMLMEKSLALTGEILEPNSVWQGSPAVTVHEYEVLDGPCPATSFEGGNVDYIELV